MRTIPVALAPPILPAMTSPIPAQQVSDERIKELAARALRENPELVLDALRLPQARQAKAQAAAAAAVLSDVRERFERDQNAPVLGNPDGDITVFEFFDNSCPYCRRVMPEFDALLAEYGNVRLVLREWPILSEGPAYAARAALASRVQERYAEMHDALTGMRSKAEAETLLGVAAGLGLDIEKLKVDMQSAEVDEHMATSMRSAEALGFNGTPSFAIGDQPIRGFVGKAALVETVAAARLAE